MNRILRKGRLVHYGDEEGVFVVGGVLKSVVEDENMSIK